MHQKWQDLEGEKKFWLGLEGAKVKNLESRSH